MLNERQKKIIDLIIKEYSKNQKPVGSRYFCRKYFPDLSPATIRREFHILTDQKYLFQPHCSAGRLPTDKAYDWFVQENLTNRPTQKEELDRWKKELVDLKNNSFSETAKRIAILCDSLTIGYLPWKQLIYKYGFKNLFAHFMETDMNEWEMILEDIDQLDERLQKIAKYLMEEDFHIFLGKDSPLTRDRNLSVISSVMPYNREKTLLILIGPKNMICEKNLNILEAARNILNQINN